MYGVTEPRMVEAFNLGDRDYTNVSHFDVNGSRYHI